MSIELVMPSSHLILCHPLLLLSPVPPSIRVARIHRRTIQKDLHNPDNHNGVITNIEPDILEYKVRCALGSITMNKASGGDGIPIELFQILKDNAVKVLHSTCQQI